MAQNDNLPIPNIDRIEYRPFAPEIVEYPDSGKTGIMGEFPKGDGKSELRRFIVRRQADENDYWDGQA
jgi:hypothetical protein